MDVKVIRSARRRKTVSARLVRDTLVVRAPAALPPEQLERFVTSFEARFRRRALGRELNRDGALESRARALGERFFPAALPPFAIEYVTSQERSFGRCDCAARRIRISHRMGAAPEWVRDYVIVHELAHLLVPRHDRAFRELVDRYPLAERARGYLIAVGMGEEEINPKSQIPNPKGDENPESQIPNPKGDENPESQIPNPKGEGNPKGGGEPGGEEDGSGEALDGAGAGALCGEPGER